MKSCSCVLQLFSNDISLVLGNITQTKATNSEKKSVKKGLFTSKSSVLLPQVKYFVLYVWKTLAFASFQTLLANKVTIACSRATVAIESISMFSQQIKHWLRIRIGQQFQLVDPKQKTHTFFYFQYVINFLQNYDNLTPLNCHQSKAIEFNKIRKSSQMVMRILKWIVRPFLNG